MNIKPVKLSNARKILLLIMAACAVAAPLGIRALGSMRADVHRGAMMDAAERMQRCMNVVKDYRLARGYVIDLSADPNETGLIGLASSSITTTTGALEAKRTSASPHMAALIARMLLEAGVKRGDRVACGFSGSFPALDIAAVSACDAIGALPVYITSVGASTYGANDPSLTAPEMMQLLFQDGLISAPNAGATPGGGRDVGENMTAIFPEDQAEMEAAFARIEAMGIPLTSEPDFAENLAWRRSVYGDGVACFINAGGGVMNMGRTGRGYAFPPGILTKSVPLEAYSGMMEVFLSEGTPVIHLLNIRKLCEDNALPYDPPALSRVGEGAPYEHKAYPIPLIAVALLLLGLLTALYAKRRQ